MLTHEKKDLMEVSPEYAICHCISVDCAMGAGVVVAIKAKYGGVKPACLKYASQTPALGTAFRFSSPNGVVYNLFSKEKVSQKAGVGVPYQGYLDNLESCLVDLRRQMAGNGETRLAMPKIASGLDRCKWEDVEVIILRVFEGSGIDILVCSL